MIEVTTIEQLHLTTGTCDACEYEGWVMLVTINVDYPIAFYVCDACRRILVSKLVSV